MKERFARLRESVALIRKLWNEDRVSFEGEFYRTESATIYDRPEQPVPIYLAASGPMVAKYAGRSCDGFICTSGKGDELYREKLLPNLKAGLEASGCGWDAIDRMIEMKVSFDTDRERAVADTKHWAALALSPEEKMSVEDPLEMERLAGALPVERTATPGIDLGATSPLRWSRKCNSNAACGVTACAEIAAATEPTADAIAPVCQKWW